MNKTDKKFVVPDGFSPVGTLRGEPFPLKDYYDLDEKDRREVLAYRAEPPYGTIRPFVLLGEDFSVTTDEEDGSAILFL